MSLWETFTLKPQQALSNNATPLYPQSLVNTFYVYKFEIILYEPHLNGCPFASSPSPTKCNVFRSYPFCSLRQNFIFLQGGQQPLHTWSEKHPTHLLPHRVSHPSLTGKLGCFYILTTGTILL